MDAVYLRDKQSVERQLERYFSLTRCDIFSVLRRVSEFTGPGRAWMMSHYVSPTLVTWLNLLRWIPSNTSWKNRATSLVAVFPPTAPLVAYLRWAMASMVRSISTPDWSRTFHRDFKIALGKIVWPCQIYGSLQRKPCPTRRYHILGATSSTRLGQSACPSAYYRLWRFTPNAAKS